MRQDSEMLDDPGFARDLGAALVRAPGTAVLAVDPELLVLDANEAARAVLGDGLRRGSPLASAVAAEDVKRLRDAVSRMPDAAPPLLLRSVSDPADAAQALLVSLVPMQGAHRESLVLLGRSASADLEREARILRARRWEIVGQLTSGVAHDLNNRLSTVTTFSDLMLSDAAPGSQDAEDLAEIKQAGLDSAEITRKLDLFAGGHAGGETDCAPPDVVRGFEKLIRRFLGTSITLETELDDSCPRVPTPPIRLEEILIALVANAREAMPDGGVLTLRAVPGGHEDPPGTAVLEVADTGPEDALPPLARALEPFFSTKPHGTGSGLGLGTVHEIAGDLGGRVSLTRRDGVTVARVTLPGRASVGGPGREGAQAELGGEGPSRVGLVEPDEAGRRALARGLARDGRDVVAAATVAELGAPTLPLDAVVLDVPDHGRAGERMVAEVRAHRPDTPIVLLRRRASPTAASPNTPRLVELAKPTDLARLRRALHSAMGQDRGETSTP